MDLQTRKLNLISYLAQIQDELMLNKIEDFILKRKSKHINADVSPFTIDELVSRIEKSEEDIKKGNFKTQNELEKISEKW